jgi:signal transduction histidine kinase
MKSCAPRCPLIVYSGARQREWEEDAYLLGVEHVLSKPVRGKLLNNLLNRLFPEEEPKEAAGRAAPLETFSATSQLGKAGGAPTEGVRALETFRRFGSILAHSLEAPQLLKQFLLLLREILGVNRAVVFLRKPPGRGAGGNISADNRWLRSACAIGLDASLLHHFGLSLNVGIGAHLNRHGRILRASGPEAMTDRNIAKEFQLLGAQIAIPILDRESLLGVAVFDDRLTGEPFAKEELAVIFHLLEEFGLAVRNAWAHDHLAINHSMVGDILARLGSGAIVFGSNCGTLHINDAARQIVLPGVPGHTPLQFNDLPQQLGSMVFTVLQTGDVVKPFAYTFPHLSERVFRVQIVPFRAPREQSAKAALLLIDDISDQERSRKLESEASTLRLVKSMAEHLAHEIGNAVVPLSTHQQLMTMHIAEPEFQQSLSEAMASAIKRITRLTNQMVFLAREWKGDFSDTVAIGDLIVEAFHEAHHYHPGKKIAQLSFNKTSAPWKMKADSKALRHAFSEIMLNALQANPDNPVVSVNLHESKDAEPLLQVEVRDSGQGFTQEAARRAPEPFYSTRIVGLGIGLTVSRRIIEHHRGQIDFPSNPDGGNGIVRVSLPLGRVDNS